MSIYNVPEQALEPKEAPNAELITSINLECEEVTARIPKMEEEYEEARAVIRGFKFLDFGLKAKIFEAYEDKIEHDKENLQAMKNNLERLGAF